MKNVESKVMEMLQAKGVNANEADIKAAIAKATSGKYELSADALDKVAGGVDPATIAALAPEIIKLLKELGILGKDDKGGDGGDGGDGGSGGGNNQDNSGNSGIQQNNQTGNNSNEGGMSQSK